jgi:hypothetical protein
MSIQNDSPIHMGRQIGIVGDEDDRPGLILAAEPAQNGFAKCRLHIVKDAIKNQELRTGKDGAGD